MEQIDDTRWEQSLEQMARRFDYPPTPAIAGKLRGRMPVSYTHLTLPTNREV